MSLYYLNMWNQVDILQKHFKRDHVYMLLWTRVSQHGIKALLFSVCAFSSLLNLNICICLIHESSVIFEAKLSPPPEYYSMPIFHFNSSDKTFLTLTGWILSVSFVRFPNCFWLFKLLMEWLSYLGISI